MRFGFTTGSCSAAAAKAACYMLLSGNRKENIVITTPKGIEFQAEILDIERTEQWVRCGVRKDGGDDPDVTTGCIVYAEVSFRNDEGRNGRDEDSCGAEQIWIDGGVGVGRVTLPGLDQPVGNAAINSVPRSMIENEMREVMQVFDCKKSLQVIISIPGGEEVAKKTFNSRLGIEGGLSVLGTSGIVEPMSVEALLKTIETELRQKRALGYESIVIAPGNYGMDFMKETYRYDLEHAVKCSNYIGATLDMIRELGFQKVLLVGHIGKLIKVSGGIMNTHSHEADCRMELMAAAGLRTGLSKQALDGILTSISTEAAYEFVKKEKKEAEYMAEVMSKISFYLKKRAEEQFDIECIVFSNVYGRMGETSGAAALMDEIQSGSKTGTGDRK